MIPDISTMFALGRPGYCLGRIGTLLGSEHTGKSARLLWMCQRFIDVGGVAQYYDTEGTIEKKMVESYVEDADAFMEESHIRMRNLVDIGDQIISDLRFWSSTPELSQVPKLIVIDTLAGAGIPVKKSVSIADYHVGEKARLFQNFLDLFSELADLAGAVLFVGNHGKFRIGGDMGFGVKGTELDKIYGPGGKHLDFASSWVEYVKKSGSEKEEGSHSGFKIRLKYKKNKPHFPFREAEFSVKWGRTLCFARQGAALLARGRVCGIKQVRGPAFYSEVLGVPEENAMDAEEFYHHINGPEYLPILARELGISIDEHDSLIVPPGYEGFEEHVRMNPNASALASPGELDEDEEEDFL